MAINQLFEGEELLEKFAGSSISLTNMRIRYQQGSLGESQMVSILLKNISSMEIASKSSPILIFLGGLSILVSLYMGFSEGSPEMALFGCLFSTIPFIIYWVGRKQALLIHPHGGSPILLKGSGIGTKRLTEFINKIEKAMVEA